ncbi:ankyrin [Decorospora gaudefroyi]|uniref:Ankyrin n=1 Tax=Decorospora gaudefroyi TaxID=184978 RepID=A0A6A5K4L6_9PLEO|nr:ankyrin [Decorospora gaudefroyi]
MSILELPIELLQLVIDIAVQHTGLQCAIKFREICRQFNEVVESSVFRLPKATLLEKRLSLCMTRKLVQFKMLRGFANDLPLCYTINRTADYLTGCAKSESRKRYVQALDTSAATNMTYWRLLDCLATGRQSRPPLEEIKQNAFIAAIGAEKTGATSVMTGPTEPLTVSAQVDNLRAAARAGDLADVIIIFNVMRAQHPSDSLFGVYGAFSDAAKNNHLDVLLFLCENWTPHLATSCAKSPAAAQIFMDFDWDINQTDVSSGMEYENHVATSGMEAGSTITQVSPGGRHDEGSKYPRLGSFVYDEHFTRWLLGKGASADARGEFDVTSVSVAIGRASMPIVRLLLNRSSGIQQGQLLHFAVRKSSEESLEVFELLLNLGCPIDNIWFQDDERSWLEWGIGEAGTALFAAVEQGRDDIVGYLLSRGADATLVSNRGRTALEVAESRERSGAVRLLSEFA